MRSSSVSPVLSNRHSSTLVACAENSAKLTPRPSQVAPSGNGWPSDIRECRITCGASLGDLCGLVIGSCPHMEFRLLAVWLLAFSLLVCCRLGLWPVLFSLALAACWQRVLAQVWQ